MKVLGISSFKSDTSCPYSNNERKTATNHGNASSRMFVPTYQMRRGENDNANLAMS